MVVSSVMYVARAEVSQNVVNDVAPRIAHDASSCFAMNFPRIPVFVTE
jgi:hypothetical protein